MKAGRVRHTLDGVASVAMGAAAIVLVWRLLAGGGIVPPTPPEPVEDLQAVGLSTSLSSAFTRGDERAAAVLIEFGDFECPFCARYVRETFEQLDRRFVSAGKVRYAFRHLPLASHAFAVPSAVAAECAARQGKFWEMRQYLYANQREFANATWFKSDSNVGVDMAQLEACVAESERSRIDADLREAARLNIRSTPTFLLGRSDADGRVRSVARINGAQPYGVFEDALRRYLAVD